MRIVHLFLLPSFINPKSFHRMHTKWSWYQRPSSMNTLFEKSNFCPKIQFWQKKTQHFHEFFTQIKYNQIKVEFLNKKWRFRTVWQKRLLSISLVARLFMPHNCYEGWSFNAFMIRTKWCGRLHSIFTCFLPSLASSWPPRGICILLACSNIGRFRDLDSRTWRRFKMSPWIFCGLPSNRREENLWSPKTGQPRPRPKWTRIWCLNPVTGVNSSRAAFPLTFKVWYSVTAGKSAEVILNFFWELEPCTVIL